MQDMYQQEEKVVPNHHMIIIIYMKLETGTFAGVMNVM
jgi:hypothetical protein